MERFEDTEWEFKIDWPLKKEKSDHICDHEELMFVQIKNKSFSQALDTSKQIGYYNLNSLNARGMYNTVRWVLEFLNQMCKISLNLYKKVESFYYFNYGSSIIMSKVGQIVSVMKT